MKLLKNETSFSLIDSEQKIKYRNEMQRLKLEHVNQSSISNEQNLVPEAVLDQRNKTVNPMQVFTHQFAKTYKDDKFKELQSSGNTATKIRVEARKERTKLESNLSFTYH